MSAKRLNKHLRKMEAQAVPPVGSPKVPAITEAQRLSAMSVEQLCDEFASEQSSWENQNKRLGRIYYYLKLRFQEIDARKHSFSPCGELLKRGVQRSMIGSAAMFARAYELVAVGQMTEEEYLASTYARLKERFRDQIDRRPGRRTVEKATKNRDSELLNMPVADLDEGKSYARAAKALAIAQEWLIEARVSWPDGSPLDWDQQMTHALQRIGRIRFEVGEKMAADPKKPKNLLDLPSLLS